MKTRTSEAGDTYGTDSNLPAAARELVERVKRYRKALETIEAALRTDSRQKTIMSDDVEYHLDGPTMYHAINTARAALDDK